MSQEAPEPRTYTIHDLEQAYQRGVKEGQRLDHKALVDAICVWVASMPELSDWAEPKVQEVSAALPLSTPIEYLDFTARTYGRIKGEELHTIGDILGRTTADLLDIRNFGPTSLDEVKSRLSGIGYMLRRG